MKVSFKVHGKPPKKSSDGSIWSDDAMSDRVLELRKCAAKERKKKEVQYPMRGTLKIELEIHTPQDITKKVRTDNYVGDLDSLVAGVCDSLRAADHNVNSNSKLMQDKEINPIIPLIIEDDSNITEIEARKISSDEEYYTIKIMPVGPKFRLWSHK